MSRRDLQREARRGALVASLSALKRLRGLSSQEIAARMGLETRAYQRFEAAEGRIDLERLLLFSEATDSDPLAIVSAVLLGRPELAVQCADNKLMLIEAMALERFSRTLGEGVRRLEAVALIEAFEGAFDRLAKEQALRDARARAWLAETPEEPDPG